LGAGAAKAIVAFPWLDATVHDTIGMGVAVGIEVGVDTVVATPGNRPNGPDPAGSDPAVGVPADANDGRFATRFTPRTIPRTTNPPPTSIPTMK